MGLRTTGENQLRQAFVGVGTERGGEFYLPAQAAGRFVDACVHESLAIVGVEGFRIESGKFRPLLDQIADFSSLLTDRKGWAETVQAAAAEAHRFLAQLPTEPELRLNFTLLSEEAFRHDA